MVNLLTKRFAELEAEMKVLEASKYMESDALTHHPREAVDSLKLLAWTVKVKNLLVNACGENSQHFKHFIDSEHSPYSTSYRNLQRMGAVFLAAKEDYEGGYLSSVRTLVQAELFGSELEQASELWRLGYYSSAAVVAGIVLETTLRELCNRNNIATGKMERMNADLTKASAYNMLIQKRVTTLAQIRNDAAHGRPENFSAADVESMISEVERFVADHL